MLRGKDTQGLKSLMAEKASQEEMTLVLRSDGYTETHRAERRSIPCRGLDSRQEGAWQVLEADGRPVWPTCRQRRRAWETRLDSSSNQHAEPVGFVRSVVLLPPVTQSRLCPEGHCPSRVGSGCQRADTG